MRFGVFSFSPCVPCHHLGVRRACPCRVHRRVGLWGVAPASEAGARALPQAEARTSLRTGVRAAAAGQALQARVSGAAAGQALPVRASEEAAPGAPEAAVLREGHCSP